VEQTSILAICLIAFSAVFFLLALLAVVMQLITAAFPIVKQELSTAYVAAISSTFNVLIPGSKVTRIEEIK
jgi:hypothetical protein